MGKDLFDLDSSLTEEPAKKDYALELEKADALCIVSNTIVLEVRQMIDFTNLPTRKKALFNW